jgi:hypothetical protein
MNDRAVRDDPEAAEAEWNAQYRMAALPARARPVPDGPSACLAGCRRGWMSTGSGWGCARAPFVPAEGTGIILILEKDLINPVNSRLA